MNKLEKLQEATMLALQGKLTEAPRLPENVLNILGEYQKQGFNEEQLKVIKDAYIQRLPVEKMKFFIDKKFNCYQMEVIKNAILYNLTDAEIAVLANPKFDSSQMKEIALGFAHNLTMDEVDIYANPKFDDFWIMKPMRNYLENDIFTKEQIESLFKNYHYDNRNSIAEMIDEYKPSTAIKDYIVMNSFDSEQLRIIKEALKNNLTLEQIKSLGDRNTPYDEMNQNLATLLNKDPRTYGPRKPRQVDYELANEITRIVKKYDKVQGTNTKIDRISEKETNFNYSIFQICPFTTEDYCSHGETASLKLYKQVIKQGTALMNELCDYFNIKPTFTTSKDTHMSLADGNFLGHEGGSVPVEGNYRVEYTEELPIRISFYYHVSDKKSDKKYNWNYSIETFKLKTKYKTYKK